MSTPQQAGNTGPSSPSSLNVSVYLPKPINERLRAERDRTGLPYTAILAASFGRLEPDELHEWLHRDLPSGDGDAMPVSTTWRRPGGGVQVQMRMKQEQRDWLDQKVELHRAASRSALVVAVLDLGLPHA